MRRLALFLCLTSTTLATACGLECYLSPCTEGEGEGDEGEGDEGEGDDGCFDDSDCADGEVCENDVCVDGGPEAIPGCTITSFGNLCFSVGGEFMQLDCESGDRYEFQFLGRENADVIGCFLNGVELDRFFSEGFCELDPANNVADENQMFLRIENGCGLVFE